MKAASLILIAALLTGCATTGATDYQKIAAKLAIQVAVIKVAEKDHSRAEKMVKIARAVREVAGGNGVSTVDLLLDYVREQIDWSKLSAEEAVIANALIEVIRAELQARIQNDVISGDKLLVVKEVAGWIEQQASLYVKP